MAGMAAGEVGQRLVGGEVGAADQLGDCFHSSPERTVSATQLSVPMQRYTPCGATPGSRLPIGGRSSPVRW